MIPLVALSLSVILINPSIVILRDMKGGLMVARKETD